MTDTIVSFGEVLLRFATQPGCALADAQNLDLVVGGAEANVGVALAALGWSTRMITALPENPLGDRAIAALAAKGIDTRGIVRSAGRMGLYFLETGGSLRPSAITYDRAGSAFSLAIPERFDFVRALEGARLLHLSGITAALGPPGMKLARAAIAAARAAGVAVSFDCNYRERLWNAWESNPRAALIELITAADILFAGHLDMSLLLDKPFSGDSPEHRRAAAEAAFEAFPRLAVMASTARHPLTQTHHRLAARVDRRADRYQTAEIDITDIIDRVGSGDAFAAGVLHGWLAGGEARAMAEAGLALGALKHGMRGDFCWASRADLANFSSHSGDVRR